MTAAPEHISIQLLNVMLKSLHRMSKTEQKALLTEVYETGTFSGIDLAYAIKYLGLEDA